MALLYDCSTPLVDYGTLPLQYQIYKNSAALYPPSHPSQIKATSFLDSLLSASRDKILTVLLFMPYNLLLLQHLFSFSFIVTEPSIFIVYCSLRKNNWHGGKCTDTHKINEQKKLFTTQTIISYYTPNSLISVSKSLLWTNGCRSVLPIRDTASLKVDQMLSDICVVLATLPRAPLASRWRLRAVKKCSTASLQGTQYVEQIPTTPDNGSTPAGQTPPPPPMQVDIHEPWQGTAIICACTHF